MKIRSNILASRAAALLGGAVLLAMLPVTAAMAQNAGGSIWETSGSIEAGSNFFIQKPDNGFGRTATSPFWLTPTTTDSNAKMDEYGKVPRSVFLSEFEFHASTKDSRYAVDFWADNVGFDNQRYYLSVYEPGRQYFNIGWDQTPHLLGSSAKTVFDGVGSTRLTVDPTLRTNLQNNVVLATANTGPGQTARNNIEGFVNNAEHNIELKTLREKFTAGYRNTMLDNWDFNVDYSNEHRTGTRPLGIGWGLGTTGLPTLNNPRPSSGSIEIPQPLDDRTQIANAAGEYVGTTPWGTQFNTSVKYTGSFFTNENKSIDVDNPFCSACSATPGAVLPGSGATQFGPSLLRYGLYPDNNVNGVTWNTAVDIPVFKSRYTSNVQYMMFRQNDGFLNDATNGLTNGPAATQINAYPLPSLNGKVNAFLTNNVLYSHLTHDVTNTARVRYYDRQDDTPTLVFANYAYADGGIANTAPLTRDPHSYSKLNVEDDVKWQLNRAWTVGVGGFFERFVFANGEVDSTHELGGKGFVNWTPWSWLTARSSLQYSQRRYNNWLAASTDPAANAMRFFFVQNRDRTKGSTVVELALFKNITVSPNGGFRWDNYPTDTVLNAAALPTNSLGTQYDRSWNVGSDLGVRVTPELRFTLGYNHEEHYLYMESCCGGSAGAVPFNDADKWSSKITQRYDTFMASALWNAMPGKLDFKADYVAAIANEANATALCTSNLTGCNGLNTGQAPPATPFPDEHNIFQRFSILAKYYVDPSFVKQMGWFGQVTAKLRYTWEKNHNTNWATDTFSPYSPSAADAGTNDTTNGGRSLFLAYDNPNYTAQIVTASINWKW